jgi:hypothetical protein
MRWISAAAIGVTSSDDVRAAREAWFETQPELDPEKPIFIDETGLNTKTGRLRGRCPRGERLRMSLPHGRWRTTTFLASLRLDGLDAPMLINGPMNGGAFLAYVRPVLAPTLRSGDVVIMDNLGCHKSPKVRGTSHQFRVDVYHLVQSGVVAAEHGP